MKFFEKKLSKSLWFQKNVLPLHRIWRNAPLSTSVMNAEIAQLVDHNLAKVAVAGPSPVFRSKHSETAGVEEFGFQLS